MKKAEFRQDIVSGEWVLFATGRKARKPLPGALTPIVPPTGCPFDDLAEQEVIWSDPNITVIRNKFPAVIPGLCAPATNDGPFYVHEGTGTHDVFVYRNHDLHFSDFPQEMLVEVIRAYKRRFQEIAGEDSCAQYIHIFHNYGSEAGASLAHPHSQIISTPIMPPDAMRSFQGAQRFFEEHNQRVYDVMLAWEREQAKRIVYENDVFVAFCPFASKYPYEVRIFAKESHAHFEQMPDDQDPAFADVMGTVLRKIKKALNDPAYNFFIHTAPVAAASHDLHAFYRWHAEILPKIKIEAGLEIGTGFGVNIIDPDEAAMLLRETNV